MKDFVFVFPEWKNFLFFAIFFVLLLLSFFLGKFIGKLKSELLFNEKIKNNREDAVKRSKAVLSGQIKEQISPFLPDFPCSAEDVRFIGKPVDFIGFCANENEQIEEILFIEVKTGGSKLSEREKQVKKVVEEKKVRYVEYRI